MNSIHQGSAADVAWRPPDSVRNGSRLLQAMRKWGYTEDLSGFRHLNSDAVGNSDWFWRAVTEDLSIDFSRNYDRVLDESEGKPFPKWFVGGRINVADLCVHRHANNTNARKSAVIYEGDNGSRRGLSFAGLDREVTKFSAQLTSLGVGFGDRVVLFMPVVPEAAVAFLAIARIGAIAVPTFSGYAADALASRLQDSEAVALITADGTTRRGATIEMKSVADRAVDETPSVRSVVVIRNLDIEVDMRPDRDVYFDELPPNPTPVPVAETDANHPLCIVYTSGTTGRPKGIVHTHGGFAVKTATDFAYAFDVSDQDVVSWISDLGWLVGPMLITGGLQMGATIVMIEGVPNYPDPSRLWDVINRNQVTVQGIAPTAARLLRSHDDSHLKDLPSLRSFVSTGEAWDEPTWWWLFDAVGRSQRPIINYSGGTEVGGGLLVSYPCFPAHARAFNGPLPGIDLDVLNEMGDRVEAGTIGELVVKNTFPGMTQSFWCNRARYLSTYWEKQPGVWLHGDLASVEESGAWHIHGRSDDTLKLSGRRVGPSEIEAAILRDRRISEVAVVGVPDEQKGQRPVAFVVVADRSVDNKELEETAVQNAGKSFSPEVVVVKTLPKTRNGKVLRRAIRAQFLGESQGDLSSLDPQTPVEAIPTGSG